MKPTTDIVEELRLYNRWRRGDEAITAPDPTTLGKLLDDAADRIEHLFASGIHTCHADCKRPMCVLRRERDNALADLARVTAERDHAQGITEKLPNVSVPQPCQMRAELAEASLKVAREQISAFRARVAELVAALEFWRDLRNESKGLAYYHLNGEVAYWGEFDDPTDSALARAESATPAVVQDSLTTEATPATNPDTESIQLAAWIAVEEQLPRTGQRVLVVAQNGLHAWQTVAQYWPAGTMDASDWDDPPEDWWDADCEKCTNPEAGWYESQIETGVNYQLNDVTHWMQLPTKPDAASNQEAAR